MAERARLVAAGHRNARPDADKRTPSYCFVEEVQPVLRNNNFQRFYASEEALAGAADLAEELEGSALGLVALAGEVLEGLLAGGHLLAAYNTAVLVLEEILLGEAAGGVLGGSVVNLRLGSNGHFKFGHLILLTAILMEDRGRNRRKR